MANIRELGYALATGNFNAIAKSAPSMGPVTVPIDPGNYGAGDVAPGFAFSHDGGIYSYFKYENRDSCADAYRRCPGLNAVIGKKTQAFINGDTWILDTEGKESQSIYANTLRKLLNRPNPIQTWPEMMAQAYNYVQQYGYCPILAIKPVGFKRNIDASMLWVIPPSMCKPHFTGKGIMQTDLEQIIDYVDITYGGYTTQVSIKDICLLKDISTSTSAAFTSLGIVPESRIRELEMPINNQIGSYESRNVLINYRGALGIFSREMQGASQLPVPPITNAEKEDLQKEFKRYGLRNNQWQFIVTTAALKWQPVGVAPKELMLLEEVKASNEAICDKYVFPFELLANEKGTTFSNRKEATKSLYQEATLPESKSIFQTINMFFDTESYGIKIDIDYSKVPALQEDEKERMGARYTRNQAYQIEWDNDLITRNQWRVANGENPIEGDDIRKSEIAKGNEPLISTIGVGGVQAAITLVTTPGITPGMVQVFLETIFGMSSQDASRFASNVTVASSTDNSNSNGNE